MFYTLSEVARNLSTNGKPVTELHILRAIARDRVDASEISAGDWRITDESLTEWIEGGANDLHTMPPIQGVWFSGNDTRVAENIADRIRPLLAEQRPTDKQVAEYAMRHPSATEWALTLRNAGRIGATMRAPLRPFAHPKDEPRFATLAAACLALRARREVRRQIGQRSTNPIGQLYATPKDYRGLAIGTTSRVFRNDEIIIGSEPRQAGDRSITVRYTLKHTPFLNNDEFVDAMFDAF